MILNYLFFNLSIYRRFITASLDKFNIITHLFYQLACKLFQLEK